MACTLYNEKMRQLIVDARQHNERYPFASMIIDEETGEEICRGVNQAYYNPTLHGEIVAINNCVEKYGRNGLDWAKLTLITTAEPCPMCQGAIIWSGLRKVVYGTAIKTLIRKGWSQIDISAGELSSRSNFNKPEIVGDVLSDETDPLFVDNLLQPDFYL